MKCNNQLSQLLPADLGIVQKIPIAIDPWYWLVDRISLPSHVVIALALAAEIVGRISFTVPSTIVARKLSLGRVSPPKGLAALNAMSSGWVQNLALSAVVSGTGSCAASRRVRLPAPVHPSH